jgi:uncharacterized membrane protein
LLLILCVILILFFFWSVFIFLRYREESLQIKMAQGLGFASKYSVRSTGNVWGTDETEVAILVLIIVQPGWQVPWVLYVSFTFFLVALGLDLGPHAC